MATNTADIPDPSPARRGASAVRTALTPAQRRALMVRSDRAGLRQLAGHGLAILLCGCWIGFRLPLWPLALPLHGVLLAFLFTALHECVPRTAFATRALNDAERRVTIDSRLLVALYAGIALGSIATGSTAALMLWLVPLLLGQPVLRLYLLAEHGRCPFVADAFVNTRTTFTNALVRALAWNMPFHAEHHAFPAVPFHRLPDLHRLVRPRLRSTSSGYARFSAEYALALGDETPKLDG